jgi:predicted DCC family thiol-disulfide oxidoreductase YuxK
MQDVRKQQMPHDAPVWLFDGHCVLCSRGVQFLLKHEREPLVRFVALTSGEGQRLAIASGLDPANPESFVFVENGVALQSSDGALALMKYMRGLGWLAKLLRLMPKSWRDAGYFFVARNRYQMFGRTEACLLPSPEQRHRFVLS